MSIQMSPTYKTVYLIRRDVQDISATPLYLTPAEGYTPDKMEARRFISLDAARSQAMEGFEVAVTRIVYDGSCPPEPEPEPELSLEWLHAMMRELARRIKRLEES